MMYPVARHEERPQPPSLYETMRRAQTTAYRPNVPPASATGTLIPTLTTLLSSEKKTTPAQDLVDEVEPTTTSRIPPQPTTSLTAAGGVPSLTQAPSATQEIPTSTREISATTTTEAPSELLSSEATVGGTSTIDHTSPLTMTALLTDHKSFSSLPTATNGQRASGSKLPKDMLIAVIAGAGVIVLTALAVIIWYFYRRRNRHKPEGQLEEPQEMQQFPQVQEEAKIHPFVPPYASSISVSDIRRGGAGLSISSETTNQTLAQVEIAVPPWLSEDGTPQTSYPSPAHSAYSESPGLGPKQPFGASPYQKQPSLNTTKREMESAWQSQVSLAEPHIAHTSFYPTVAEHSSPCKSIYDLTHEDNSPYISPRQAVHAIPPQNQLALPGPWQGSDNRSSSIISNERYMNGRDTMYTTSSASSKYPTEGVLAVPGGQRLQPPKNMESIEEEDEEPANARRKKPLGGEMGDVGSTGSEQDRWEKVRRLFTGEAPSRV